MRAYGNSGVDRGRTALDGAVAGAAGAMALNACTYLDIIVRARPASSTPEESARRLSQSLHLSLGPEDRAANRLSGLGPLLGNATGVATAVAVTVLAAGRKWPLPVAGVVLGSGAMFASNATLVGLGVTDPRRWSRSDWLADALPHLAYGFAAAATWYRLGRSRRSR